MRSCRRSVISYILVGDKACWDSDGVHDCTGFAIVKMLLCRLFRKCGVAKVSSWWSYDLICPPNMDCTCDSSFCFLDSTLPYLGPVLHSYSEIGGFSMTEKLYTISSPCIGPKRRAAIALSIPQGGRTGFSTWCWIFRDEIQKNRTKVETA